MIDVAMSTQSFNARFYDTNKTSQHEAVREVQINDLKSASQASPLFPSTLGTLAFFM
jgi:hypothetical protein